MNDQLLKLVLPMLGGAGAAVGGWTLGRLRSWWTHRKGAVGDHTVMTQQVWPHEGGENTLPELCIANLEAPTTLPEMYPNNPGAVAAIAKGCTRRPGDPFLDVQNLDFQALLHQVPLARISAALRDGAIADANKSAPVKPVTYAFAITFTERARDGKQGGMISMYRLIVVPLEHLKGVQEKQVAVPDHLFMHAELLDQMAVRYFRETKGGSRPCTIGLVSGFVIDFNRFLREFDELREMVAELKDMLAQVLASRNGQVKQ
jgi:hypothetical protein